MNHMTLPKGAKMSAGALLIAAVVGTAYAYSRDEGASADQATDNAYVRADFSTVAPKVRGTIAKLLVEDNQRVKAGQLLAVIDDRDFQVAVAAAEAELAAARATAKGIQASISRQGKVIDQAAATVDADGAAIALSRANASRYGALAKDGSASLQEQQEATSRLVADQAARRRDLAAHSAAGEQVAMLAADLANARAAVDKAEANIAAARLNLSYTRIHAPIDGVIGRRSARIGNYVEIGTPLLAVVPLDKAYVEANLRETQLRGVRPGQAATIGVDSLPGVTLRGHVESVSPASGVTFAAIAPENGTGNFTKIVQRLPVRIRIDPGQPAASQLRVGMSVTPSIDTNGPR